MNTTTHALRADHPDNIWYRNFWVWVVIALPTSAVLACAVTIWLVLQAPDPVVAKEFTAEPVNEVLGRNSVAPPKR
jgi:hypothetical protein